MPLARSTKSPRSPAVPTTQLPAFQPPSFYAAASGIPYPRTFQYRQQGLKISDAPPLHYEQFMPLAQPHSSSSESSLELPKSRQDKKSPSPIPSSKHTKREKRQSQIAGLPQIEAHLLPSLRDTVDRMTRPISHIPAPRANHIQPNANHFEYGQQETTPRSLTSLEHSPSDFSSNTHEGFVVKFPNVTCLGPKTTHDALATPKAKPKSLIKVPTPRLFQGQETPKASSSKSNTSPLATPSLRSVKSILSRKPVKPEHVSNKNSGHMLPNIQKKPIPINIQPPQTLCPPQKSPSVAHHTPNSRTPVQATPRLTKKYTSSIPRLRARFVEDATYRTSDSSDFESRYERERRDLRRLTVTNADKLGSSSSGNDTTDDSFYSSGSSGSTSRIGLGLDYKFPAIKSPRVRERVDDSEDDWTTGQQEKQHRLSMISSISSNSQYSTDDPGESLVAQPLLMPERPKSTLLDSFSKPPLELDENERRRAALLDIVSTLDQNPFDHLPEKSESSEYTGEQGIALGSAGDAQSSSDDQIFLSFSPEIRQSNTMESTVIPTFFVSSESVELEKKPPQEYQRRSQYIPGSSPLSVLSNTIPIHFSDSEDIDTMDDQVASTTTRLARRSFLVAAREREAFGLKPSDSELYHQRYVTESHSRTDSRVSASESSNWVQDDTLSSGAKCMFLSIVGNQCIVEEQQQSNHDHLPGPELQKMMKVEHNSPAIPSNRTSSLPPTVCITASPPITISKNIAHTPKERVLEGLQLTEETFVKNMQTCIEYYILPLRIHGSRSWISGVPPRISRFLDWFEDILHLHEQVLEVLRGRCEDIVRQLYLLLPRFEIYQPYVASIGQVVEELETLMVEKSDFGYFVDLQDKESDCVDWTLRKYIIEPEYRLAAYLDLFSELFEATPRDDKHHVLTYSVLQSMRMIIDVLTSVKREEEDHRLACRLLKRIQGPRSMTYLADRQRNLLWHGSLILSRVQEELDHNNNELHLPQDTTSRTRRLSRAIFTLDSDQPNWHEQEPSQETFNSQDSIYSFQSASASMSSYSDSGSSGSSSPECGPSGWKFPGLPSNSESTTTTGSGAKFQSQYPEAETETEIINENENEHGSIIKSSSELSIYVMIFSDLVVICGRIPDKPDTFNLLDDIGLVRIFGVVDSGSGSGSGSCQLTNGNPNNGKVYQVDVIPIDSTNDGPFDIAWHLERISLSLSQSFSFNETRRCTTAFTTSSEASEEDNQMQMLRLALERSALHTTDVWCHQWKGNNYTVGNSEKNKNENENNKSKTKTKTKDKGISEMNIGGLDNLDRTPVAARVLASIVDSGLPLPRSPSACVPVEELNNDYDYDYDYDYGNDKKALRFNLEEDGSGSCSGSGSCNRKLNGNRNTNRNQEREERGWWSVRFHQVMCAKRQKRLDGISEFGNLKS